MLRRFLAPALAATLCACASGAPGAGPSATARLRSERAPGAQGTVDLQQSAGLLRVFGTVGGLAPNTRYRLEVRDSAGCAGSDEAPAAGSAGTAADRLPDLHADAAGIATFSFDVRGLSLDGPSGVLGRGLAVRAAQGAEDDAPGAAAGRPQACGTIRPR